MSQGFGPNSPFGRFSPINQGPTGMPTAPAVDPPGYYLGWPLANAGKRLGASLIDWVGFWVIAWFVMVVVWGALGSAGGEAVGQTAVFPLLIVIYALGYYNVGLQQSRTGQSWGKRFLGLRLVKMNELRPPSKFDLTFRPIIGVFEMLTGVGILSMLLSRYRQSFGDRFAGTVVIDESRAGMTLPWVLPTDPVVAPGPPQPKEESRVRQSLASPGDSTWGRCGDRRGRHRRSGHRRRGRAPSPRRARSSGPLPLPCMICPSASTETSPRRERDHGLHRVPSSRHRASGWNETTPTSSTSPRETTGHRRNHLPRHPARQLPSLLRHLDRHRHRCREAGSGI